MTEARQQLQNCPLCGASLSADGYRPLPRFRRDHIVRCRACGFRFSLLIPSTADYERVYGVYDHASEDDARSDINLGHEHALVRRLMAYRSTGNVLDIAAGAGRFLEHFRDAGMSCYATEFNDQMQEFLATKGFNVLPGGLFPEAPSEGMFDIVIFTEIIEHINIPMPVIERIFQLLRLGGCIYLTTPNFNSLERRLLGQDGE